jgi:hypothetical protein
MFGGGNIIENTRFSFLIRIEKYQRCTNKNSRSFPLQLTFLVFFSIMLCHFGYHFVSNSQGLCVLMLPVVFEGSSSNKLENSNTIQTWEH